MRATIAEVIVEGTFSLQDGLVSSRVRFSIEKMLVSAAWLSTDPFKLKVLFTKINDSPNVRAELFIPTLQDIDTLPFLILQELQNCWLLMSIKYFT